MTEHQSHANFCGWHVDQFPHECTCGHSTDAQVMQSAWAMAAEDDLDDDESPHLFGKFRLGDWQQVYSGTQFWPLDPRAEEIHITDIAHALALQCRYAGHCSKFYSVAEHSVLVSYVLPPELALKGLLHDATEAYCVDVPRPLKPFLRGYAEIEDRIWREIAKRFELTPDMPSEIKYADNAVLLAEKAALMGPEPAPWHINAEPAAVDIECWSPEVAEARFLTRFYGLTQSVR